MSPSRDDVLASMGASFPEEARSRVMQLLDSYGVESYERESERVQLAILKLSRGSEEKVREYVAAAKLDYRDVLLWADNPEESKLDTPEKKKEMLDLFEKLGIEPPDDLKG